MRDIYRGYMNEDGEWICNCLIKKKTLGACDRHKSGGLAEQEDILKEMSDLLKDIFNQVLMVKNPKDMEINSISFIKRTAEVINKAERNKK